MTYQIKYYYKTGDSYGSSDREDILELEYESLDKAKETIKRIKEHWEWYKYKEQSTRWPSWPGNKIERPEWHKVPPNTPSYFDSWNCINLVAETGKEVFFWPDWVGYFEKLYGVKIINKNSEDDGMEYWADEYKKWDYK